MAETPNPSKVTPGLEIKRFRRVVTGHNGEGLSVILTDDTSPHIMPIMDQPNFAVTDFWKTAATPADNRSGTAQDPCGLPIQVAPPANGSVFRVVQFPPDKDWAANAPDAVDRLRPRSFRRNLGDHGLGRDQAHGR
jgi:hypothetical protein